MRRVLLLSLAFLGFVPAVQAQGYDFQPVTDYVNTFVGKSAQYPLKGASLIVIQNRKAIYKQGFGSYARVSPTVPIASASKWLSALVLQRLVEEGRMSWNDTVADYYGSDYPNADATKGAITLGQLFSHTSGMSAISNDCLQYPARNMALDDCAKAILGEPLVAGPGTLFAYGENSMQVAGAMAERATGKTWAQLLDSELIQPLGLTGTDFGADKRGRPFNNPIIAGGARSNQRDYAIVVQMVLQRGMYGGKAYLSPASIAEMQRDRSHGLPIDPDADPYPEAYGYGYGEWVNVVDCNGTTTRVSSTGVFGSSPWVDYDNGIAAVFLAYQQAAPTELRQDLRQLWDEVADVIGAPVGCSSPAKRVAIRR
ncbi:MAG: serine hydrolase domain-containing protein [Thermomonas sp.]